MEALQVYGPANIKKVAEAASIPDTTVRFRIRKLTEQKLLLVTAHLNYAKLGLARGFLIAESPPGNQEFLLQAIKKTDYWDYLARCYGKFDGYIAYFAFPAEYKNYLEKYFDEAAKLGIFSNHLFFWITNSYFPYISFEWYDFKDGSWNFRWHQWIDEITDASENIPEILVEPKVMKS